MNCANPHAIGHVRYSTTGSCHNVNCQPLLVNYARGQVAVAHNGNLINAGLLRKEYEEDGAIFNTTSDTEVILHLLARPAHLDKPNVVPHVLGHLQGAYSLLFLFPDRMVAARDPFGFRPLVLGKLDNGAIVVASETCAFDIVDAEFLREVEPGEVVTITDKGIESSRIVPERGLPAGLLHLRADLLRRPGQRRLRRERAQGPAGDGGPAGPRGAGRGGRGHPRPQLRPLRGHGLRPGQRYPVRTRLHHQPLRRPVVHHARAGAARPGRQDEAQRDQGERPGPAPGRGRGLGGPRHDHPRQDRGPAEGREPRRSTSAWPARRSGTPATSASTSPRRKELIANQRTVEEIRDYLEVDSLHYLSLEGMLSCVKHPARHYCTACFSGQYPMPVDHQISKFALERYQLKMFE